ncbi:CheR family methyltransferase [Streptomyces sp. NPDC006658]|uniref:CheR family methyltransferase n=1 Tax=Streptomyces sp. NPDC006658 TaxID=3156900 RepID=UPI0033D26F3D
MKGRRIVTEWFRVPAVWPLLVRRLERVGGPVTVWSGACGTGEEAYSAAILLDEHGIEGEVYATDIDVPNLATARAGVYEQAAIGREVAEGRLTSEQVARYFEPHGRHQLRVRRAVRDRVEFGTLRLGEDLAPECHAALLRNVWRHLSPEAQRAGIDDVWDALDRRGVLLLGGGDLMRVGDDGGLVPTEPEGLSVRFREAEHALIWRPWLTYRHT